MESLTSRIVSGCSWGVLGVVLGIGVNSQITATSVMRKKQKTGIKRNLRSEEGLCRGSERDGMHEN